MAAMRGYFDGKVIVPDRPLAMPANQRVVFDVEADSATAASSASEAAPVSALDWVAGNAIDTPNLPTDLAHQHDHYLYGTPKKS